MTNQQIMALDYGGARVGVAMADSQIRIAIPYGALENTESLLKDILQLVLDNQITKIVVGYPRNQSGQPTAQTAIVEAFSKQLQQVFDGEIVFQDESLTSVLAEQRLQNHKKSYTKADIDAHAAAIILEDYLEGR